MLNSKITSNKTKYLLVENELAKLETFDSIYFGGKSYFYFCFFYCIKDESLSTQQKINIAKSKEKLF